MARLANLESFNNNRKDLMKIKNASDEAILMTSEDLKAVMIDYLKTEMNFFADGIAKQDKIKLVSFYVLR